MVNYSKVKPTKSGFYWAWDGKKDPVMVEVRVGGFPLEVRAPNGYWRIGAKLDVFWTKVSPPELV